MMPESAEFAFRLPLFDEAAQALKENGSYQRELTSQELASIMAEVVASLLGSQEAVRASIPVMEVRIENAKGVVFGSIRVNKPIQATIKVTCTLVNDTEPGRIRLADLDIQQEAGLTAKIALKAANIEGRTRNVLRDPNRALGQALASQLEQRGVKLTGLNLHFNESTLDIRLNGESV
jgi:hypothetical protein